MAGRDDNERAIVELNFNVCGLVLGHEAVTVGAGLLRRPMRPWNEVAHTMDSCAVRRWTVSGCASQLKSPEG